MDSFPPFPRLIPGTKILSPFYLSLLPLQALAMPATNSSSAMNGMERGRIKRRHFCDREGPEMKVFEAAVVAGADYGDVAAVSSCCHCCCCCRCCSCCRCCCCSCCHCCCSSCSSCSHCYCCSCCCCCCCCCNCCRCCCCSCCRCCCCSIAVAFHVATVAV